MGIDVFGAFQKKERGKWIFVEKYNYSGRGYLRSWLAPWGIRMPVSSGLREDIEPIAPFRGFPPDGPYENVEPSNKVSWLTADEILDSLPVILKCTIRLPYDAFLKQREKEYWDSTYVDPDRDGFYKEHRFITAKWRPYEDGYTIDGWGVELFFDISENRGIKAFTDKVQELKTRHGEVRYIFDYG